MPDLPRFLTFDDPVRLKRGQHAVNGGGGLIGLGSQFRQRHTGAFTDGPENRHGAIKRLNGVLVGLVIEGFWPSPWAGLLHLI